MALAAASFLPRLANAQEPATDLRKAFREGMATLNDEFWVPELPTGWTGPARTCAGISKAGSIPRGGPARTRSR